MGFVRRRSSIRRGSRGTRGDKPDRGANLKKSYRGYKSAESDIFRAVKEGAPYSNRGVYIPANTVSRLPDILSGTGTSLKDIQLSSRYSNDFASKIDRLLETEVEILQAYSGGLIGAKKFQGGGLNLRKIDQTNAEPSKFRFAYEALKSRMELENDA